MLGLRILRFKPTKTPMERSKPLAINPLTYVPDFNQEPPKKDKKVFDDWCGVVFLNSVFCPTLAPCYIDLNGQNIKVHTAAGSEDSPLKVVTHSGLMSVYTGESLWSQVDCKNVWESEAGSTLGGVVAWLALPDNPKKGEVQSLYARLEEGDNIWYLATAKAENYDEMLCNLEAFAELYEDRLNLMEAL